MNEKGDGGDISYVDATTESGLAQPQYDVNLIGLSLILVLM